MQAEFERLCRVLHVPDSAPVELDPATAPYLRPDEWESLGDVLAAASSGTVPLQCPSRRGRQLRSACLTTLERISAACGHPDRVKEMETDFGRAAWAVVKCLALISLPPDATRALHGRSGDAAAAVRRRLAERDAMEAAVEEDEDVEEEEDALSAVTAAAAKRGSAGHSRFAPWKHATLLEATEGLTAAVALLRASEKGRTILRGGTASSACPLVAAVGVAVRAWSTTARERDRVGSKGALAVATGSAAVILSIVGCGGANVRRGLGVEDGASSVQWQGVSKLARRAWSSVLTDGEVRLGWADGSSGVHTQVWRTLGAASMGTEEEGGGGGVLELSDGETVKSVADMSVWGRTWPVLAERKESVLRSFVWVWSRVCPLLPVERSGAVTSLVLSRLLGYEEEVNVLREGADVLREGADVLREGATKVDKGDEEEEKKKSKKKKKKEKKIGSKRPREEVEEEKEERRETRTIVADDARAIAVAGAIGVASKNGVKRTDFTSPSLDTVVRDAARYCETGHGVGSVVLHVASIGLESVEALIRPLFGVCFSGRSMGEKEDGGSNSHKSKRRRKRADGDGDGGVKEALVSCFRSFGRARAMDVVVGPLSEALVEAERSGEELLEAASAAVLVEMESAAVTAPAEQVEGAVAAMVDAVVRTESGVVRWVLSQWIRAMAMAVLVEDRGKDRIWRMAQLVAAGVQTLRENAGMDSLTTGAALVLCGVQLDLGVAATQLGAEEATSEVDVMDLVVAVRDTLMRGGGGGGGLEAWAVVAAAEAAVHVLAGQVSVLAATHPERVGDHADALTSLVQLALPLATPVQSAALRRSAAHVLVPASSAEHEFEPDTLRSALEWTHVLQDDAIVDTPGLTKRPAPLPLALLASAAQGLQALQLDEMAELVVNGPASELAPALERIAAKHSADAFLQDETDPEHATSSSSSSSSSSALPAEIEVLCRAPAAALSAETAASAVAAVAAVALTTGHRRALRAVVRLTTALSDIALRLLTEAPTALQVLVRLSPRLARSLASIAVAERDLDGAAQPPDRKRPKTAGNASNTAKLDQLVHLLFSKAPSHTLAGAADALQGRAPTYPHLLRSSSSTKYFEGSGPSSSSTKYFEGGDPSSSSSSSSSSPSTKYFEGGNPSSSSSSSSSSPSTKYSAGNSSSTLCRSADVLAVRAPEPGRLAPFRSHLASADAAEADVDMAAAAFRAACALGDERAAAAHAGRVRELLRSEKTGAEQAAVLVGAVASACMLQPPYDLGEEDEDESDETEEEDEDGLSVTKEDEVEEDEEEEEEEGVESGGFEVLGHVGKGKGKGKEKAAAILENEQEEHMMGFVEETAVEAAKAAVHWIRRGSTTMLEALAQLVELGPVTVAETALVAASAAADESDELAAAMVYACVCDSASRALDPACRRAARRFTGPCALRCASIAHQCMMQTSSKRSETTACFQVRMASLRTSTVLLQSGRSIHMATRDASTLLAPVAASDLSRPEESAAACLLLATLCRRRPHIAAQLGAVLGAQTARIAGKMAARKDNAHETAGLELLLEALPVALQDNDLRAASIAVVAAVLRARAALVATGSPPTPVLNLHPALWKCFDALGPADLQFLHTVLAASPDSRAALRELRQEHSREHRLRIGTLE